MPQISHKPDHCPVLNGGSEREREREKEREREREKKRTCSVPAAINWSEQLTSKAVKGLPRFPFIIFPAAAVSMNVKTGF